MMNAIVISFRFLFSHKWKLFLTMVLTLFFLLILFPLSDLNDLISAQVSRLTGNKVFLQLDKMNFNPISAAISLEKLYIETPQISSLPTDELKIIPSISALLTKKLGGKITATGFLKGGLEISVAPISSPEGIDKSKFEIIASNINLNEARSVANFDLPIKGELSLSSQIITDLSLSDQGLLTMTEQPDLDINMAILKFELASTFIPLQDFGQIAIPEIKFGKVELKGKLSNGKFLIENGKLGTSKDELYGDVKGDVSMTFQNINGQISPVISAYNISLDIKALQSFKDRAKLLLSFLDGYKIDSGEVSNYKFKIYSSEIGMPPQFTPLR